LALLVTGLAVWLADIPIGYYQFKRMCEKEGGLVSYVRVDPAFGWLANNEVDARIIVQSYLGVPFARFRSENGAWLDVRYVGGKGAFARYDIRPAGGDNEARYRQRERDELVESAIRLRKSAYIVLDERTGQIVFQSTRFIFTWTNSEKTLLGRSDSVVCPTHEFRAAEINKFLSSTKE
jgi:hypothetical protein